MDFPKAFAVLGPTAGGKTGLALRLAQRFPLEIISLDSALVYREMDIGTAKPTAEELASVPHHLIDIISPLQSYSAAEFAADCLRLCGEISARGRMPLIVGGTMMYFHALVNGLNDLPQADAGVRAQLQAQKAGQGVEGLYRRLCEVDAATAARLKPGDSQRIERALEVFLLTGRPLSDHFGGADGLPRAAAAAYAGFVPAAARVAARGDCAAFPVDAGAGVSRRGRPSESGVSVIDGGTQFDALRGLPSGVGLFGRCLRL